MTDADFQALRKEYSYEDFDDLMMRMVSNYVFCGEPDEEGAQHLMLQLEERIRQRLETDFKSYFG